MLGRISMGLQAHCRARRPAARALPQRTSRRPQAGGSSIMGNGKVSSRTRDPSQEKFKRISKKINLDFPLAWRYY
jgi:hypothetical protein